MRYEVDISIKQRWVMVFEADNPAEVNSKAWEKALTVPADEMHVETRIEKGADR